MQKTGEIPKGWLANKKIRTGLFLFAVVFIAATSYFVADSNYPLFHSFADLITVFIAASVFLVVWNGRRHLDNQFYLFVGIAFMFFAFLDFLHLLGNKDMGVFQGHGNLGPTFYIASRYVLGISMLVSPLFIKRRLNVPITFAAYSAVSVFIILSVFTWNNFPATFIEGRGLTAFKVDSDYLVSLALAVAIVLLFINRRAFDNRVFRMIALSLVFSIATGLAFTLYTDPFGITNMVGHFFQIGSFALVYGAFVETAMTKPQDILYHNLKQSNQEALRLNADLEKANADLNRNILELEKAEEAIRESEARFRTLSETSPVGVCVTSEEGVILYANPSYQRILGYRHPELEGVNAADLYLDSAERDAWVKLLVKDGIVRDREQRLKKK